MELHTARCRWARRTLTCAAAAAAAATFNVSATLGQTVVTWLGPGNSSWSDAANWSGGVVPIDNGGQTYDAHVSSNGTIHFDVPGTAGVSRLTLGTNSTLDIRSGNTLTIGAACDINGVIRVQNSGFTAAGSAGQLSGNARLFATAGGTITLGATQYLTGGVLGNGAVLFSADGAGSAISLPALTTLQYGYNGSFGNNHYIAAMAGGLINLSGLTNLSAFDDDFLNITASGGGTVDLSSLQNITINGNAGARVDFNSAGGSAMNLPQLATINAGINYEYGVKFNISESTFSLPQLASASNVTFNLQPGATLNLPKLGTATALNMTVPSGATVNAGTLTSVAMSTLDLSSGTLSTPNLRSFTGNDLVLGGGGTLNAPAFEQIDNSGFRVSGGKTLTLADTTYVGTTRGNGFVMFEAAGLNTVINASAMSALQYGYNGSFGNNHYITATAGGLVNLSGLTSLSAYDDDFLRVTASGGGTVDLSNLQNITINSNAGATIFFTSSGGSSFNFAQLAAINGGSAYQYGVQFNVTDTIFSLPQLASASAVTFTVQPGSTLNLPKLGSATALNMTVPSGATVNAGTLVTLTSSFLDLSSGTLNAPNLRNFTGSDIVLGGGGTLTTPAFEQIDNSGFKVSGGKTLTLADTTYVGTTRGNGFVMFEAAGLNTVINASAMSALQYGYNGSFGNNHYITATAGGLVDFSSLTSLSAFDDDILRVTASGGGTVNLSSLQNITLNSNAGATIFFTSAGGSSFNFAQLAAINAGSAFQYGVQFDVADAVLTLPQLASATAVTFNMQPGSTLNLPKLGTTTAFKMTVPGGTTVNAGSLTSMTNSFLDLNSGTFNAPNLKNFTSGDFALGAGGTLNAPAFLQIDNSGFAVSGGKTLTLGDTAYVGNSRHGNFVMFQATGTNSVIDASAMSTMQYGYNVVDKRFHEYITANGSAWIDLSRLVSLSAADNDALHITATGGGTIDLSSLEVINLSLSSAALVDFTSAGGTIRLDSIRSLIGPGAIQFNMSAGAKLTLPRITIPDNSSINVTGLGSSLEVGGDFEFLQSSFLTLGGGSSAKVRGSFSHNFTDENRMVTSAGIFELVGPASRTLEVAGTDSGAAAPGNNGNFGLGQLVIGETGQATVITLVDVINNGNRGGPSGQPEALYLFGLGGPQGLLLRGGSTLVLSNLNVYTTENGAWTSLQGLFTGGQTIVPYTFGGSDGFLVKNFTSLNLNWINPGSEAWDTAGNWDLNTTPAAPHAVTISPAVGVNVNGPSGDARVRSLLVDAGTGTTVLTLSGATLAVSNGLAIGQRGFVSFNNGTLLANSVTNLGGFNQSPATSASMSAFANAGAVSSSGVLTVTGEMTNTGFYSQNAGTAVFGRLEGTGSTLVGGSAHVTAGRLRQSSATISGRVVIPGNGSPDALSVVGTLAISGAGKLDIADNDALLRSTSKATVEAYVASARSGGAWTGAGLTSSAAAENLATGLGVLSGAEYLSLNGQTFDGTPVVASDTLVKYTWNGDTNFSGVVNFDDYVRVDVGFNTNLTGWANGDFNYSGSVNFDDYVLIDVAFNTQSGTLGRAVSYLTGEDRSESGRNATSIQEVIEHFEQFGAPYAQAFLAAVPEPSLGVMTTICAAMPLARRRRPL